MLNKKQTMNKLTIAVAGISAAFLASCSGDSRFPDYEKTETGIYYQNHKEGDQASVIKEGDVLFISQVMFTEGDSLLFDSRKMDKSQGPYAVQIGKTMYPGDMFDALKMMHVGDSSTFCLKVSDMWNKGYKQPIPPFLDSASYLKYSIRIDSVYSKEKVDKLQNEQKAQQQEMMKKYQALEDSLLSSYISANKITAKPTQSGLIYIEKKKGKGALVQVGDSVTVAYKGMFTDGTVFDSSEGNPEPFTFPAGKQVVIAAWDETLMKMNVGTKALIVCPSDISYGPYGYGSIPPFTPLVFEMELIGIKSAK